MNKIVLILIAAVCCLTYKQATAQKIIGDCTITYKLSAGQSKNDSADLRNTYKKFYVSGGKTVTEIVSNGFEQKTYYNENADDVYILYKMNNENYMRKLTKTDWLSQYEKYKNSATATLDETRNILGYTCKKGKTTLSDGTVINFYYTPELKTVTSENPYEFKDVNGLVLSYEAVVQNNYRITYTASNIDFNPVPAATFVVPKTGYRLLTGKDF